MKGLQFKVSKLKETVKFSISHFLGSLHFPWYHNEVDSAHINHFVWWGVIKISLYHLIYPDVPQNAQMSNMILFCKQEIIICSHASWISFIPSIFIQFLNIALTHLIVGRSYKLKNFTSKICSLIGAWEKEEKLCP